MKLIANITQVVLSVALTVFAATVDSSTFYYLWSIYMLGGLLAILQIVSIKLEAKPATRKDLDDVFLLARNQNAKKENEPLITRTFKIFRKESASFSLGDLPDTYLKFTLGELVHRDDDLLQEIYIFCPELLPKHDPSTGSTRFPGKFHSQGATMNYFRDGRVMARILLANEAKLKIFLNEVTISISIGSPKIDTLSVKVEIRRSVDDPWPLPPTPASQHSLNK